MRIALAAVLVFSGCVAASAHEPLWHEPPIGHRFEPIPPLGNNLPPSYRARYNRPTYIGGKIAYHIAPSSQEAMSWHVNVHRGAYRNHAGWIEPMYIYPKPWEVIPVGPRTPRSEHAHHAPAIPAIVPAALPVPPPALAPPALAPPALAPLEYGEVPDAPVIVNP